MRYMNWKLHLLFMRAKSEEVRLGRWEPKQGIYVNLILAGMQIFFQSCLLTEIKQTNEIILLP